MKNRTDSVIFAAIALASACGLSAQQLPTAPSLLSPVRFGMSTRSILALFPSAKRLSDSGSKELLFEYFTNEPMWDAAMFDFDDDKLTAVNLLALGERDLSGSLTLLVRALVKTFGRDVSGGVVTDTGRGRTPTLSWLHQTYPVYLQFSPANPERHLGTRMRLVITVEGKVRSELFANAGSSSTDEQSSFRLLLPKQIEGEIWPK